MERLLQFLGESSLAISIFYGLYWLLLKNTTHFRANRIFLLAALLMGLLVSLFHVKYEVSLPPVPAMEVTADSQFTPEETETLIVSEEAGFSWKQAVLWFYFAGLLFFLLRSLMQSRSLLRIILKNRVPKTKGFYLHENKIFPYPFSFFNHIFFNPEYHQQEELSDILVHEQVHIRERHWIDLLIIEAFTVIYWFNPIIWLFGRAIKQNHEYLADQGVLTRGHSAVRYQALLVNQLMGMQVIGLTNSLTFALGPTRLKMMTKQKTPKMKLLRMAWIVPALAVLLVAFAEPEYQPQEKKTSETKLYNVKSMKTDGDLTLRGTVVDEQGEPLPGASIVLRGTTVGTTSNQEGKFELKAPKNVEYSLVASFVGYETAVNEANISDDKAVDFKFIMKKAVITISTDFSDDVPPPPPPPAPVTEGEIFTIVEELPAYPMGHYGLGQYVKAKQKELKGKTKDLSGKATVGFTVNAKGEVTNIRVLNKTTDTAAKAVTAVAAGMAKWTPGKQHGKAVPVNYAMELEF